MTCKCKGGCKKGHYDVQIKGWMDKGGHYDEHMKRCIQNGTLRCAN